MASFMIANFAIKYNLFDYSGSLDPVLLIAKQPQVFMCIIKLRRD
jgi:hypothetical protein